MSWSTVIWNELPGGNVEHIAAHNLTPDEVDHALATPIRETISRESGLPAIFGLTPDGTLIFVSFEEVDEFSIRPVTAFQVGQR